MRWSDHLGYLLLFSASVAGCYPQSLTAPSEPQARAVEVIELQRETVRDSLVLLGEVEPWRQTTIYFEVSGIVEQVFVEEGQSVETSEPLAQLVQADYQLACARAAAELRAAQANHELLKAGTRKEDLEAAQAEDEQTRIRAAYWTGELKRNKDLFGRGTVTASVLEQVQREHDAALQEKLAAKSRLDRAVAGPRKQELEAAQAAEESSTQSHLLAQRQLTKATIRSPFPGRIEKRLVDQGAYVNVFPTGGVPIVQLVDLTKVDVVISVPEKLRPLVDRQASVDITSASDPQISSQGRIVALGSLADPTTGTYPLRVRLDNANESFHGGMVVTASIDAAPARQVIRIPLAAVRHAYGQRSSVMLLDSQERRVVLRQIVLGPLSGNRIEVTAGLEPGELLVIGGQHSVVAGDTVVRSQKSRVKRQQEVRPD